MPGVIKGQYFGNVWQRTAVVPQLENNQKTKPIPFVVYKRLQICFLQATSLHWQNTFLPVYKQAWEKEAEQDHM